jgi:hypothetical protein
MVIKSLGYLINFVVSLGKIKGLTLFKNKWGEISMVAS